MHPILKNKVTYTSKKFRSLPNNKLVRNKSFALKCAFKDFFETSEYSTAIVDIPLKHFGITSIDFKFNKSDTIMIITLDRPGLLIGKGGEQFNILQKYLSVYNDVPVKIEIIESKMWNY